MTITAVVEVPGVTGTPAEAMTETNLNEAVITLELTDETFVDTTLETANFTLTNAPVGTTVEGVSYTDDTHADVSLAFDGTDFDTDVTDFTITVEGAELRIH